jgi:hypothetical protein
VTTKATVAAEARSTYVATVSFYDEDGVAAIPTAIQWTLKDADLAVVNSRANVSVAVPAATINILLYEDDLALNDTDAEYEVRYLIVTATYNSTLGSGLPLVGVLEFKVLNTYAAGLLPSVSPSLSRSPSSSASPSA